LKLIDLGEDAPASEVRTAKEPRRADIQGLRALAVIVVLIFHAGLPLPGGFVGVDIFFVLSGFVITKVLLREWNETGQIRFGSFYLRRFRRLTPALALMVTCTVAFSVLVLSPLGPLQTAAKTGLGAMLLSANAVIANLTGQYFDAPAETNPLLNTWSLAVEEQFYLIFPAILALGWAIGRRMRNRKIFPLLLVAGIAISSFVLSMTGSTSSHPENLSWLLGFYSPLTRAWEFAAGAFLVLGAVAIPQHLKSAKYLGSLLGVAGLGMVAASLWLISGSTPFPGVWTLLPVLGTVLLLVAGTASTNPVSQALSWTPMVKIGDWSYSIYLWHWPFIVFAVAIWPKSHEMAGLHRPAGAAAIAALLSLLPAMISYVLLEKPIRSLPKMSARKNASLIAVVVTPPILVCLGVGLWASHTLAPRYESGSVRGSRQGDVGEIAFFEYLKNEHFPCTPEEIRANAGFFETYQRCKQSKATGPVDVALLGDSYSEMLYPGFAAALPEKNVVYYGSAMPIPSDETFPQILDYVVNTKSIKTVIIAANWTFRQVPMNEFKPVLKRLTAAGKQVYVIDENPTFPFDPQRCKFQVAPLVPQDCTQPADEYLSRPGLDLPALISVTDSVPGAKFISVSGYFCQQGTCDMTKGNSVLYRDPGHLNLIGSPYEVNRIIEDHPEIKG